MNNVLTQLQIDLYSSTSYEVIKAQQGDKNSRVIEFVLYSQGEPYEFSDNIFFRFVGHRGDGSSFSKTEEECITRNGNHVSVTLPEDVLYYDGIIEAKLVMYESGDPTVKSAKSNLTDKLPEKPERTVLSTIPFKISCIKNPCNENDLSEGEVSIVTDLIFQMEEFSKNAQDVIDNAQNYATLAQSYAVGGTGERENEENDNAMHYYNQTKLLESSAKESKDAAKTSEINAAGSASSSNVSATTATQKANDASTYAKQAQSYALGTGNARPDERTDNAKYYYEQARNISSSFRGALRPMGTVTFANLPELVNAGEGDMYNISDQFKTNENFKEGNGLIIPAGSNVYKTADGKWDILAGSPVTGVKGAAEPETAYHTGNVNLTPAKIGAPPTSHASTATTYGASSTTSYGHAMASSTTPKANGTAAVGSETAKFARGDHVHPLQTSVATATKAMQDGDGNIITDSYSVKKVISSGSFNSVMKPGLYTMRTSSVGDAPPDGGNYHGLIVLRSDNGDFTEQIAFKESSTDLYVRYYNSNSNKSDWKKLITEDDLLNKTYPIGSIYMSASSTSPATLFGGTWARWGNGRIPVGVDTTQTEFNTIEKTGGEKTHVLTEAEMPQHNHSITAKTVETALNGAHSHTLKYSKTANTSGSGARVNGDGTLEAYAVNSSGAHTHNVTIPAHNTDVKGSGTAHNNLPPYITCYMWKRTA